MISFLAVFPPAIVFQISDSDARLSPSPIPLETSLPNTLIYPDQLPVSATDVEDIRYISAVLAKSIVNYHKDYHTFIFDFYLFVSKREKETRLLVCSCCVKIDFLAFKLRFFSFCIFIK